MIWGEAHHLSRNQFVYTTDEDYDPPHSLPTYKDSGNEGTTVVKQPLCHSKFKRHFYIFQELRDIHPSYLFPILSHYMVICVHEYIIFTS